jgi:hypothetical protein
MKLRPGRSVRTIRKASMPPSGTAISQAGGQRQAILEGLAESGSSKMKR